MQNIQRSMELSILIMLIESGNKKLCLICNETIADLKEYNIKRHYETKHFQNYSKYTGYKVCGQKNLKL